MEPDDRSSGIIIRETLQLNLKNHSLRRTITFTILIIFCCSLPAIAEEKDNAGEKKEDQTGNMQTDISGQWFISYLKGTVDGEKVNLFVIKRGYINFKTKLNDTFSGRMTPDISIDQEGDGAGDLELRLKYAYLKWNLPSFSFIAQPYFELGLVHLPWLNFEENINHYRAQGTMFLPRNGVVSSADFGVTLVGLFGGQVDEDYQKNINKTYPGRYGSFAIGVHNGGGYHAFERNNNKPLQGRLSLRPFPDVLPGFQVSYYGIYGKGNTRDEPDWITNMGFVSIEHRKFVLTGSYYTGVGNAMGSAVDSTGKALDQNGYSFFAEYKIPEYKIGLFGRYDFFTQKKYGNDNERKRHIIGIAYYFHGRSKFILNYDNHKGEDLIGKDTSRFEVAIEVRF